MLSALADVLTTARRAGCTCAAPPAPVSSTAPSRPGPRVDAAQVAAATRIRETCARAGGSAVVVDAPAAVKAAVDVWGPVPALDLMRRVKDQFDPDHRLAPGRFVGGSTVTDQRPTRRRCGETGSIVDLGTPVPGGAFDEHHPPDAGADR